LFCQNNWQLNYSGCLFVIFIFILHQGAVPEIHNYNVEVPTHTHSSELEPEKDPLDITICNSSALLKEPLAPDTPITSTPFFAIAKSDLLQQLIMTTMTQTTTQVMMS